jgi:chromosomal replication initiator protein
LLLGDDLAEAARLFNPLTLIGPSGSGKSQLAQAIVRHWRGVLQHSAVEYFTAADFGREAQAAAAEERLAAWQAHIRGLRLLVIEDLHRLRTRSTIHQEMRHAVDAISENGGVIVITTQREPAALIGLDAGLRDRLAGGLTLRLQSPGLAARKAILRSTASSRSMLVEEAELDRLAHREAASPAELMGRLQVSSSVLRRRGNPSGSLPLAGMGPTEHGQPEVARAQGGRVRAAIGEGGEAGTRTDHPCPDPLSSRGGEQKTQAHAALKHIIAVTARYFAVTQTALTGPSRRTSLVEARNIVVHLARRRTDLSYAEIGRSLGGRDHTTIMHAERRVIEQSGRNPAIQQALDELDRLVR